MLNHPLILTFSPRGRRKRKTRYSRYDSKRDGLGDDFSFELKTITTNISWHPEMYQKVDKHANVRRAPLHHFPFIVVYRILSDHVMIISLFNTHMNPEKLFDRALQ